MSLKEVTGPGGQDMTAAVKTALDDSKKEAGKVLMDVWFEASQRRLSQAAEQRSGAGPDDSEGKVYRENNQLTEILQSFTPPRWNPSDDSWTFNVTHAGAVFNEFGATPHEIEAKQAQALAFEWPDAPKEIREKYEDTFPLVFFDSVKHPGTPAIGYVRHGRDKTREVAKNAGISAQEFARAVEDE